MICPKCGGENRDTYKFCAHCGTPRPAEPSGEGTVFVPEAPTVRKVEEAPPPPSAPDASIRYTPEPAARPRRKRRGWLTCLVIFLILLCIGVVALVAVALLKPEWLPFEIPFDIPFLTQNNQLIVGFPNADGETDLYLLRIGQTTDQGLLLADQVMEANGDFIFQQQDAFYSLSGYSYAFGAFVPGQDYLLYWFSNGNGAISLNRLALSEKTPVTLWQEDAESLWGALLPNLQDVFLRMEQDSEQHCYISRGGSAADEVLQGSNCYLTTDLSAVIAKSYDGTTTTASIFTLVNNTEFTPLDAVDNIGAVDISGDGERLAYTDLADTPHVVMINSQDSAIISEGPDEYAVVAQGFAERGHVGYFISENDDGNLELYLLSDSGASLVHTDTSIAAEMSLNGSHLLYVAGEYEGERTLFVRDVSSGSDVELLSGMELRFELGNPINRIFISTIENGELAVYSANIDGSGMVSLFTGEGYQLRNVYFAPQQPYVFLYLTSEDGITLLATHPDLADEFLVVENWASLSLQDVSTDGLQLLYAAAEGADDDESLYLAQLDTKDHITLDDDVDGIGNALFSANEDTIIYTALTGNNLDDAEIRRIQVDAIEPAEVLYTDAVLVAAQWDTFHSLLVGSGAHLEQSTSYCPGAQVLTLGRTQDAHLEAGDRDCYRYRGSADETVTFWIEAAEGLDVSLSLYDRQGNFIESDESWLPSSDPSMITTIPDDGIYYLEISSFGETTGDYSLSGISGANYCPGAQILSVGEEITGQLGDTGHEYFSLTGNANNSYTFWVEATEGLDTSITLYDLEGNFLNSDDNSRNGVDPLLIATLPEDGSYCLEVNTFGFDTGPFTIAMVEGSVFCPGADPIGLNETVTGSVSDGQRVCYYFETSAGTAYNFVVDSPTDTDTVLELYDGTGELIDSDDDGGGYPNPLLYFLPDQSDTYYIIIRGYSSSSSGDYEMTFEEAPEYENPFADAPILPANQRVYGAINRTDTVYLPSFDYEGYGDMYYFDGTAGQTVQIDAFADSLGSDLDPYIIIFNDTGTQDLASDDDSGTDYDAQLVYTLPYSGRYYLMIIDAFGDYGSGDSYFYELLLDYR